MIKSDQTELKLIHKGILKHKKIKNANSRYLTLFYCIPENIIIHSPLSILPLYNGGRMEVESFGYASFSDRQTPLT